MYSLPFHLRMASDRVRMSAYREALERAVKPGCAVADIGTGTGIFAVLACQFGARRVYAIEPATAIDVARQVAAENGVADRIEFIPELSIRISLPERVDVVVSDVRGVLPWSGHSVSTVIDARKRFLTAGGTLIPARDRAWAALAREPHPWDAGALEEGLGVDMSAVMRYAANTWRKVELTPGQLLVEPQQWATVDYEVVASPNVSGKLSWAVAKAGIANGLCVWFDTELVEGVGYSNAPGEPKSIYGQAFFPLEAPVEVAPGDRVTVEIRARLVEDQYVWRWDTGVRATNRGVTKAAFEQSTIRSNPVSLSRLRRREAGHSPALEEDGEIDRFVLSLMDGAKALSEIARLLAARFPERFGTPNDALARVAQLSEKYSR